MSASRYAPCARLTRTDASGRAVEYLATRILPLGDAVAGPAGTDVRAAELYRLDLVAYRTLRDPDQAWRIADANDAIDPFALCARVGDRLRLPASTL